MQSFQRNLMLLITLSVSAALPAPLWASPPNQGQRLTNVNSAQENHASLPDGSGGAIVAWQDLRDGTWNIYAQHVRSDGTIDPLWPAGGREVCTAGGNQELPSLTTDGQGGAIAVWQDQRSLSRYDVYAQHVLANGTRDPSWPLNGRALCTAAFDQSRPSLVPDGQGGAIACWRDARSASDANGDIYAQHVLGNGSVDPAWPVDGRSICANGFDVGPPVSVADGLGGAFFAWHGATAGAGWDIYVHHVMATGTLDASWPACGVTFASAFDQTNPRLIADSIGGLLLVWMDNRGNGDLYAQRVLATGAVDATWAPNGVLISDVPGPQVLPELVGDGSDGAIIAWLDYRDGGADIYASHLLSSGQLDANWPVGGLVVIGAGNSQYEMRLVTDEAGGAFACWRDDRNNGESNIFAHHILASGTLATDWPVQGLAVCTDPSFQVTPQMVADGFGGAVICWNDLRPGRGTYVQRTTSSSDLMFPDYEIPRVASVRDVPGDQGGKVKLSWTASGPDRDAINAIVTEYWIWRSVPPNTAAEYLATRGWTPSTLDDGVNQPQSRAIYKSDTSLLNGYFWEFYAAQPVGMLEGYSLACRTEMDSLPSGNPLTVFFVQARGPNGFIKNSAPDSGYSVDNLAPSLPIITGAQYGGGASRLHWLPNAERDLFGYLLFRGLVPNFVPDLAHPLAVVVDTGYADPASGPFYYKIAAKDIHGNLSSFAIILPTGRTGVPGDLELAFSLSGPRPNPTIGSGLNIEFTLPSEAPASLEVIDVGGRRVLSRDVGKLGAGRHVVDLMDSSRLPAGHYLVRLRQGVHVKTSQATVIE